MPTLSEQLAFVRNSGVIGRRAVLPIASSVVRPTLVRTAGLHTSTARPYSPAIRVSMPSPVRRPAVTPTAALPARAIAFEGGPGGFVSRYKAPAKPAPNAHPVAKPSVVAGVPLPTRSAPINRINVPRVAESGFLPGGDRRGPLTRASVPVHVLPPGKDLLGSTRENRQSQRPAQAVPPGLEGVSPGRGQGGGRGGFAPGRPFAGGMDERVLPRFDGGLPPGQARRTEAELPPGLARRDDDEESSRDRGRAFEGGRGRTRRDEDGELLPGLARRDDDEESSRGRGRAFEGRRARGRRDGDEDELSPGLARRVQLVGSELPPPSAGSVAGQAAVGAAGAVTSGAPGSVGEKLLAFAKDQPVVTAGAGIGLYFGLKYLIAALA